MTSRPGGAAAPDAPKHASDPTVPRAAAVRVLAEPELEFRHGQRLSDPKAGLALFGPYDADRSGRPTSITYGVIGRTEGVALFEAFSARMGDPIISTPYGESEDRKEQLLWPPFPGFEAAFACQWPAQPAWSRVLNTEKLLTAARHNDKYQRAYDVTNMYLDAVRVAKQRDENFGVIVCVVPDEVWENCRPLSRVEDGVGIAISKKERQERRLSADLFDAYKPEQYDLSVDFRRQLKARVMEHAIPVQIVRESTLLLREVTKDDPRSLTKLSDRAWNLGSALYYKAGGKPWRLATARKGVCYVGLAFRRSEVDEAPETACCAAQMFLDSGDGVVFRGEFGPWYSMEKKEYQLSAKAAEQLLCGVLAAYHEGEGEPLTEIFLHSRSTISREEFEGYRRACPDGVKLVGVRVRRDRDGLRLYRHGDWPVLRGTVWVTGPRTAYLWASGFKPTVLSYDGWEVPAPLRIDIEHGAADVEQVARDILGLTKLNYNTCKLGDGQPVTVGFSDAVGEILVGNPNIKHRLPSFKFYI
jgi:hypothetical protein